MHGFTGFIALELILFFYLFVCLLAFFGLTTRRKLFENTETEKESKKMSEDYIQEKFRVLFVNNVMSLFVGYLVIIASVYLAL